MTSQPHRLPPQPGEALDRSQTVTFTFNGQPITAHPGDTLASALAAAGVRVLGHSTKYLRPRGVACGAGQCGQCLVQVGADPMVAACTRPAEEGLVVEAHQMAPWPGPEALPGLPPVEAQHALIGFHYKHIFSRAEWPIYDGLFREANGQGRVHLEAAPDAAFHEHLFADVAVVGAGPAGLAAARAAARHGARVLVLDENPAPGGHTRYSGGPALPALPPEVTVLTATTVVGWYQTQWLAAYTGNRLLKIRAGATIVAAGAYERPGVFENNDLPGVMLGSAVERWLRLYAVRPGARAVVATANADGWRVAAALHAAGVEIAALVDERPAAEPAPWPVHAQSAVVAARGEAAVTGAVIAPLAGGPAQTIACDLLVTSLGWTPALEIVHQAGGQVAYDPALGEQLPTHLPPGVFVAGRANGVHSAEAGARDGVYAGERAAAFLGLRPEPAPLTADRAARTSPRPPALTPGKCFVCACIDVTAQDVADAAAEGLTHVELVKRYTKFGTGPCQGKQCGFNAAAMCAVAAGQPLTEASLTTIRQPIQPVAMGLLAGQPLSPTQVTPLHTWHAAHGAVMLVAGAWLRPLHYGDVAAEVRAVRERVGLIDVSTLGKLRFTGPGAPALLNRLYLNRMDDLKVGRVRYGVMANDEAVILDDGVTARLGEHEWYTTTTTSGATTMFEYIQWWMQSGWGEGVHCTDLSEAYSAFNLAGPQAREVLAALTRLDLAHTAFPYMAVREASVAGVPCRLMRIGFTGELSYEIHVPSAQARPVWEALVTAGAPHGLAPFGVEAQRILRLEKGHIIVGQDTEAITDPIAANMAWAVKMDKPDFLGRRSLERILREGVAQKLTGFTVTDPGVVPDEGVQIVAPDALGKLQSIGYLTSCKYSPTLGQVIGLCWLPTALADQPGQTFTIRLRDGAGLVEGRVHHGAFYDPQGERLRA